MPDYPHHSNHTNIHDAIIAFGNLARGHGLQVGIQETMDVLAAAKGGATEQPQIFRYALRSIYCCSEEDMLVLDKIFDWFWGNEKAALKSRTSFKNQTNLQKNSQGSLVMLGLGKQQEGEEATKNTFGANAEERLRKTDFSKLETIENQWLEQIAMRLWKQMGLRLKRKMKSAKTKGRLDLRNTIRHSIPAVATPSN